tara:strand:+ start:61 stop:282 length:222 start_codon:yes stop_codon:yes gene_type:complete
VKVGDLVKIKNTSTGDARWMIERFRDRTPLLVCEFGGLERKTSASSYALLLDIDGERKWVPSRRLMVWEMEGH